MWFEYISFMCEFFFGIGFLAMLFGLPTLLIMKLIIMPAIQIRKAMKSGKTFKEAFKAEFPNDGSYQHQFPTYSFYSGSGYQSHNSTNFALDPAYRNMPGNINYRY